MANSEAGVQTQVRLTMARLGALLYRNNSGAFVDERGRQVRFGLGNDSAQLNKQIKSSDLIGVTPVVITPEMVGRTVGVFTALEVKEPGWHLTPGDQRGQAQLRFINLIRSVGGFAGFVTDPAEVAGIIGRG